jgi:hypothetical protein
VEKERFIWIPRTFLKPAKPAEPADRDGRGVEEFSICALLPAADAFPLCVFLITSRSSSRCASKSGNRAKPLNAGTINRGGFSKTRPWKSGELQNAQEPVISVPRFPRFSQPPLQAL